MPGIPWLAAAAQTHEWLHGPPPDVDVVKTQGKHLSSRPSTPIFNAAPDLHFLETLDTKLEVILYMQAQREYKYGEDIAKEWPINHTPPEIKASWTENQAKFDDLLDNLPPTPSDDGSFVSSSFGNPGWVSRKPYPVPVVSVPKVTPTKDFSMVRSNRPLATLTTTSQRRLSEISNVNLPITASFNPNSMLMTETIPVIKTSRKRRHSDLENDSPPTELRRSKRRIASPRLRSLVSAG